MSTVLFTLLLHVTLLPLATKLAKLHNTWKTSNQHTMMRYTVLDWHLCQSISSDLHSTIQQNFVDQDLGMALYVHRQSLEKNWTGSVVLWYCNRGSEFEALSCTTPPVVPVPKRVYHCYHSITLIDKPFNHCLCSEQPLSPFLSPPSPRLSAH